jgi:hypothetical protein
VTAVRLAPSAGVSMARGGRGRRSTAWRVALAIARVEGIRLLRHPATIIGLLLSSGIATLVLVRIVPVMQRETAELAAVALPAAGGVLLAAHLAASRLERDQVLPLACAAPSTVASRTAGLVMALLSPVALVALWTLVVVGVMLLVSSADDPTIIGMPALGDVLAPSATVLVFGALGVALGRWLPAVLVGSFALPVLAVGTLALYDAVEGFAVSRLLPVADWVAPGDLLQMRPRAPWLHLAYVSLVAAALVGIALYRDRRTVAVAVGTAACVAAAAASSIPLVHVWNQPELVTRLMGDIRDPAGRLRCDAHPLVPVCVPPGYEAWRERLRDPALAALATVPAAPRPAPVEVHLRPQPWHLATSTFAVNGPAGTADRLPPDVAAALPRNVREALVPWPYTPQPPRLARHVGRRTVPALLMQYRGARGDAQRLDIALGVLAEVTSAVETVRQREQQIPVLWGEAAPDGSNPAAAERLKGCPPGLEAREVLTFALAALSHPDLRTALETELAARPFTCADERAVDDWFTLHGGGVTGSAATDHVSGDHTGPWSRAAATLGLALSDHVGRAEDLHAQWDRWTDPATSADELVEEFGLSPLLSSDPSPRVER